MQCGLSLSTLAYPRFLRGHSKRCNANGVAAQGFALNLTEEGSSISFAPKMTKLPERQNGLLSTKTRQATSSVSLKYEIGTTYSLRVELETPGTKKSVERSVLLAPPLNLLAFRKPHLVLCDLFEHPCYSSSCCIDDLLKVGPRLVIIAFSMWSSFVSSKGSFVFWR